MQRFSNIIIILAVIIFIALFMSSFSGCGVLGYGGHYYGHPLFYSGPPVFLPMSPSARAYREGDRRGTAGGYVGSGSRRSVREGSRSGPGNRGGGIRGGK